MPDLNYRSPASSPLSASATPEDALAYYKSQYLQLESELADFQSSSRELEVELEKDIEAAEKRERQLQERAETLGFEVEEWKAKYKQAKMEANAAQNTLQKEITTLRDSNRTMQLKLRDIEVANDDFERQARNTTSSLEDIESKYNVAIERGVLFEEEIRTGEQERESLRIAAQRFRDELSDLKVEAEIRQDKLRRAEAALERQRLRTPAPLVAPSSRPHSFISERSPTTTASSPTVATPTAKSASSAASDTPTPPSPPTSDKSLPPAPFTPIASTTKSHLTVVNSATPRPSHARPLRHSRGPSLPVATPSAGRRTPFNPLASRQSEQAIPSSASLTQIRGLIGKMQKLEQRVHSARSKLPGPVSTPPRASPRPTSALSQVFISSSVTVRSQRKRTGGSIATSVSSMTPLEKAPIAPSSSRPGSRLSFGIPVATPTKDFSRTTTGGSRPTSRHGLTTRQSLSNISSTQTLPAGISRPTSRQSVSRTQTPLGHYANNPAPRPNSSMGGKYMSSDRPKSSMGGNYAHRASQSVSRLSNYGIECDSPEAKDVLTPTPSRRTTFGTEGSSIPLPGSISKRQSGTGLGVNGRRIISIPNPPNPGEMGPPLEKRVSLAPGSKKMDGVGESY